MKRLTIAVDIDGILTFETEGHDYKNRTPNPTTIRMVNQLFEVGFNIILYTSRMKQDQHVTEEWLKQHGVRYHTLVLQKLQYDILLDDKAVSTPIDLISQIRVIGELNKNANLPGRG